MTPTKESTSSSSKASRFIIEIVEERPSAAEILTRRVFNELDRQMLGATFEELFAQLPQGELTLLARSTTGELIGTTRFAFSGGLGELHSLVVDPRYQRQGVGSALLRIVETLATTHGLHAITLTAPTFLQNALTFYEKRGYQRTACIPRGRLGFDWVIFTKNLHQPTYPWLPSQAIS